MLEGYRAQSGVWSSPDVKRTAGQGRALLASLACARFLGSKKRKMHPMRVLEGEDAPTEKMRKMAIEEPMVVRTSVVLVAVVVLARCSRGKIRLDVAVNRGWGLSYSLLFGMRAQIVQASEYTKEEIGLQSSLRGTIKEMHSILTDAKATCACNHKEMAGKDEELSEPNKRDQLGGQGNQGFKEVGGDPSNLVEDIQKKISRYASGTTVLWM
ncbi:hypothetical protein V6N13_142558 [Hibiscus sabdariffa]